MMSENESTPVKNEMMQESLQEEGGVQERYHWTPDKILWILGFLALLVGAIGMYQRFAFGLRLTDLGSFVPWGLWVATYEYLVWLEVGSLVVFTILVYVFKWNKSLPRLAPMLYLTAFAILSMALILIGLDLGHPFRFWHVLVYPQWGSLMTWMIWLHMIYLVVLLGKLALELRPSLPLAKKIGSLLSYVSLPLGIALVVVAGSVFGVVMGRPTWQSSALPIMFLISSLVAGTGFLVFQYIWFFKEKGTLEYFETGQRLGKLLLGLLIIGLTSSALGGLVILYPGVPAQATALELTLFGPFWWVYWVLHIGLGVIIPIILLLTQTRTARRIGVAAGLLVVTFIAVPLNIVIPPQLAVETVEKGLIIAYQGPGLVPDYFPTVSEWLVTLFAMAFGFLVFLFGFQVLKLRPRSADPVKEG
jgi:protein NrfD